MNIQSLPPKMARQFAELAKNGKADYLGGGGMALFYRPGNQEVCVHFDMDDPIGFISKLSTSSWELKVKEAAEKRLLSEKA